MPLAGPDGLMRDELTVDGVHPIDAGYTLLETVVLQTFHAYRESAKSTILDKFTA